MSIIPERAPTIPSPVGPLPELGETLRVVNVGPATLRFAWNSRQYVLSPSGAEYMPFDAMKLYCGDPRATNVVRTSRDSIGIISFLPDRATEVRRLRLLYAAPFGEYMQASDVGSIFMESPTRDITPGTTYAWEGVRIPQVEVYNIRGERIYTVLDDPEGTMTIPVNVTQHHVDRSDQLATIVEQQARLIDALSERLGIDPNSPALDNSPDLVHELLPDDPDDPDYVPPTSTTSTSPIPDSPPKMVYDPQSDTVKRKPIRTIKDPTDINDIPEDRL